MKIFIKNLSEEVDAKELREAAEEFGKVNSVAIINDVESGKPSGIAYIEMASKAESEAAIKGLKGLELKGKKITAKEAAPEATSKDKAATSNSGGFGSFKSGRTGGGFGQAGRFKGGANRGR